MATKKSKKKKTVPMECAFCFRKNYYMRYTGKERFETNRYCPHCQKHTVHKQST